MPPKEDPKLKLAVSEKNGSVTNGSKDGSVKSGQVAAKHTDAQNVTNPKDLFSPAEGGAKTGHGTPPTKEAAASAPTAEGPEDTEMEDATLRDKIDFGRDSDYDQAMQIQQALASERDDLQLQLEGYRQQVEHLKAAEADLFDQCKELEEKFSRAQVDLVPCQYKAGILETVTEFLKTDHTNVMDTLGQVMHKMRSLEKQIAEFESHEDAGRIAELESQLRNEQGANMKMRRTIAEHEKQLASGSAGAGKSLVECAQEIGFIRDASGKLLLGPPASRGFDYSKPYAYTNRTLDVLEMFAKNQSVHALPPLKTFLGDYKEDKISLPEFLKMFKRSWRRKKGI
ncbi:hypothetical protein AAVH_16311 [Aphelenchoides avenae]|nr:hypothetical protein AAVH_16311 [Aphelenchus avenae]